MSRPMIRRLARLARARFAARRRALRAAGRAVLDTEATDDERRGIAATLCPYRDAALCSLTVEQIEILAAPGARWDDLPELTDAQRAGLQLAPHEMDDATRAAVLALPECVDDPTVHDNLEDGDRRSWSEARGT